MFDYVFDRTDGYLRIDTERHRPSRTLDPQYPSASGLLFVDIEGSRSMDDVAAALQRSAIPSVRYVLFRSTEADGEKLAMWLAELSKEGVLHDSRAQYVGAVQFHLGKSPKVHWCGGGDSSSDEEILARALRAEMRALLEWGHAIWIPNSYHYELPSGDHSSSFIRVGDMFRTIRDIEVTATWLYEDLCDRIAILTDSASIVPLVIELKRVLELSKKTIVGTATFDEYPHTDFELSQVVHDFDVPSRILAIVSVSASGRYLEMIQRALIGSQRSATLTVLIDKLALPERCGLEFSANDSMPTRRWVGLASRGTSAPRGNVCGSCMDASTAQVVTIDPRSFEAMALPGDNLVMPAFVAAKEMSSFFEACDKYDAINYMTHSGAPVRKDSKSKMPVKFELDRLVCQPSFVDTIIKRIEKRRSMVLNSESATSECESCTRVKVNPTSAVLTDSYDCVVVADYEYNYPGFPKMIERVREGLEIDSSVSLFRLPVAADGVKEIPSGMVKKSKPLVIVLGAMTGWTLRQILVSIEDEWNASDRRSGRQVSALVIHSVSRTKREYENTCQSFGGRVHSVWQMYLPSRWPLEDELEFMSASSDGETDELERVVEDRTSVVTGRLPGRCVLLGSHADVRVRNESLYGARLGSLATLVAVGAAMHASRQVAKNSDPRWPSFDFASISRSYYDGLLIAAMLRWCDPGEVHWGTTHADQRRNVEELLARFTREEDVKLLYPEMLLAVLQGKLHSSCVDLVAAAAANRCRVGVDAAERKLLVSLLVLVRRAGFDVGDAEAISVSTSVYE